MWILNHSICSPGQEVASSQISYSDIQLLAQSKSKHIPEKFCLHGSLTDHYLNSLSGMTSRHSESITQIHEATLNGSEKGVGNSSFVAGSRNCARISALQEKVKDSAEKEVACGLSNLGSFVKWDQDTHTWKTAQLSLLGGLESYSETWPKSGLMRNGVCYQAERWEPCISESESGYSLPTIVKSEGKGSARKRYVNSALFRGAKMSEGLRTCEEDPIYLNPCFAEVVMGWPMGWTDLQPLETAKFREWQQLHTIYLADEA